MKFGIILKRNAGYAWECIDGGEYERGLRNISALICV